MHIPRVVIAGATSGVGKTTVSVAVMDSVRKKGYKVQPFKVGPDFIDPSYHDLVAGRPSPNLDLWMMGKNGVLDCFARSCEGAGIAIIEGVMGLFDGVSGKDNFASTAHVAKILKSPVILVVDSSKAARSIAAIILGFLRFDRGIKLAGVILNNVASERHAGYLREAVESKIRIPILGMIRRERGARIEERHLGLVPAQELEQESRRSLLRNARLIAEQVDIDGVIKACSGKPLGSATAPALSKSTGVKIAVALDESFNFYYQDNLDALRNAGAEVEFFSPVNDSEIPQGISGIILGGGFPEVLADRLEKNVTMIKSLRRCISQGTPVYGECGGLMYMTRSIRGYKGSKRKHRMLGLIDAETVMTGRLTLNYTEADCKAPLLGKAMLRGHEFHYSELQDIGGDIRYAYCMTKGKGIVDGRDGAICNDNGLAAYTHLHFGGNRLAKKLVSACVAFSRK